MTTSADTHAALMLEPVNVGIKTMASNSSRPLFISTAAQNAACHRSAKDSVRQPVAQGAPVAVADASAHEGGGRRQEVGLPRDEAAPHADQRTSHHVLPGEVTAQPVGPPPIQTHNPKEEARKAHH
eukprot:CAMPEP_0179107186 /NCGR_PEP_ID=MMETSP0796-20121207/49875_1 /TAXON_ID=73915 /ORGANISM="Pyrodinium bahamense, Strain pbaha01" /LENGTH=125 /DNA_ID=CAMNT_0020805239 /DNA_START=202 /DNA_END=575 /DNA_ORIENTATION=+